MRPAQLSPRVRRVSINWILSSLSGASGSGKHDHREPGMTTDPMNRKDIMGNNPSKRPTPKQLQADRATFAALQAIGGYAPANPAFTVANGQTALDTMVAKQTTEVQEQATADASRDDATSAELDFHNFVVSAKEQVIAQFGKDSNEVQSIGLKKKSEYKKPKRSSKIVPLQKAA